MSTEEREVRLEVYLNGTFYSADSYWASVDKEERLEFEITDAIYDLIGCSTSQEIDVQRGVVTDDHVSVSYCSPGEMKVQLEVAGNNDISVCEMNRNDNISELKSLTLVSEDLSDPAGPSVKVAKDQTDENNNSPT
ncbi:hypothetical protein M9458_054627, partial [Cirrhinus mrigala]